MADMPKFLQKWMKRPITVAIDTREQNPLKITKYAPHIEESVETLDHGDYSLVYPDMRIDIAVERKSIDDFVQSMSREHDRFTKELKAMRGYKYRMVIVEGELTDLITGNYRSNVSTTSLLGFISYWSFVQNIPFLFSGDHEKTSYMVANMLNHIAIREIKLSLLSGRVLNVPPEDLKKMLPRKLIEDAVEDIRSFYEGELLCEKRL